MTTGDKRMYVEYYFYTSIYGSKKLKENEFNKFIEKSIGIISSYTFDRVNEKTIDSFPIQISTKIKKCACELAEYEYDIDRLNSFISIKENGTTGVVKNITAGAVSKTYETKSVIDGLSGTNSSSNNNAYYSNIKRILNNWLYPQYVDYRYYNLLSWVI